MALHEQCVGGTDEWYTPPHVFAALGCRFDMDVAAPRDRRFVSTPTGTFISAGALSLTWSGFVWMNPPFGARNGLVPWLEKFFEHGNGIALVPDRTSAPWWQRFAPDADAVLFVAPKLKFVGADGRPGASPAQGTCLFAAGPQAAKALQHAKIAKLGTLMVPV
jgi:hypothetical protein